MHHRPRIGGGLAVRVPSRSVVTPLLAILSLIGPVIAASYFFLPSVALILEPLSTPAYILTLLSVALGCTAFAFGSVRWRTLGLPGSVLGAVVISLLAWYMWRLNTSDIGWSSPVPPAVFLTSAVALTWAAVAAELAGVRWEEWRLRGIVISWSGVAWVAVNIWITL
jgi:hypothetical protein